MLIGTGKISSKLLEDGASYVVDSWTEVYVWHHSDSTEGKRQTAAAFAQVRENFNDQSSW